MNSAATYDEAVRSIVPAYKDAFRRHGNSLAAMLIPKDRQEERFDSLTRPFPRGGFSVLDYGCGLAHLKKYLDARTTGVAYTGVDVVEDFIEENRRAHSEAEFHHISSVEDVQGSYDFTVLCGVFNLRYGDDEAVHRDIMHGTLTKLFERTRVALCINFLSSYVDFQSPDAYHQDPLEMYAWARDALSPRLILDHGFMPYEFSLIIFRDATILRPQHVYRRPAFD